MYVRFTGVLLSRSHSKTFPRLVSEALPELAVNTTGAGLGLIQSYPHSALLAAHTMPLPGIPLPWAPFPETLGLRTCVGEV